MRTLVSLARQCLSEESARVLDDAVGVARQRRHSQTTSLHVVSALLCVPSSLLREACDRVQSYSVSPKLQFRALELCLGVAFDRLPSSKSVEFPPISNSLMAAIKRSQAQQRRNPDNYHLQQIHCNQQTASLLKVDLKYFVLAILDDPMVSRVFGEAGFLSRDIKLAIIQPSVTQFPPRLSLTRCPPIFLYNLTDSFPGRAGLKLPFGPDDVDENCRRIGEVLAGRDEKKGKNPLLVGVCANSALKGFVESVNGGKVGLFPRQIYGLDVVCVEYAINEFVGGRVNVEMMMLKFKEVESAVGRCSGPGVVVNYGELKVLVSDSVSTEAARFVVSQLTSLLKSGNGEKLWLIGAATSYETYLKMLAKFPGLDNDWDLQLLPIHWKSSLMGSFVPFGGFFSSPPDFKNPVRSKSHYSTLCYLCTEKLEQEVAALLKLESSDSVTDQCLDNLTSSDRIAALDTSKGVGTAKAKDDVTALNAKIMELQRKWNDTCQSLHRTQLVPKLDICQRSHVQLSEFVRLMANRKGSSSKYPSLCESQCTNPSPGAHMLSQNISSAEQNATIPLSSEADNVNFKSRLPINSSTKPQSNNDEHLLPPHPLADLYKPHEHTSFSFLASVTTDLGLGKIYPSTRQEANTPKLIDNKEQCFSGSISAEFDAVSEGTFHNVAQSSSCSAHHTGEPFDPRDYKTLRIALAEKVGWQDEAICTISQAVSRWRIGNGRDVGSNSKRGIWLAFLGPDKVGKKKIASALAEIVFGNKGKLIHVDVSSEQRVSQPNSIFDCQNIDFCDCKLRGKVLVDYIYQEFRSKPYSVVFLEDLDKAADPIVQSSLTKAISTGKFTDSYGRDVSISSMIFVATSTILKGKHSVHPQTTPVKFSEEIILGAKRWQMQTAISHGFADVARGSGMNVKVTPRKEISNPESRRKRKRTDDGDSPINSQKQVDDSFRSYLDLNLPADEAEEAEEDTSSEKFDSDTICENSGAWLEDFFDQTDAIAVFQPLNFDLLAEKILREIQPKLQRAFGFEVLLEIDYEILVQILAATWLSDRKKAIENWIENVVLRSFYEVRRKYHFTAGSVVKLVAHEGLLVEEEASGIRLPKIINV